MDDDDSYPAEPPADRPGMMTDSELNAAIEQSETWVARAPLDSDAYRAHRDHLGRLYHERDGRKIHRKNLRGYDPALRFIR